MAVYPEGDALLDQELSQSSSLPLNPGGYCCVIKLPKQNFKPPVVIELRPEKWKSRKWMVRPSGTRQRSLGFTKQEKYAYMRDLCRDTCWVLCCPPCSSVAVADKLAFSAPRKPNYWPLNAPETPGTPDNACAVTTRDYTGGIKVFWVTSRKGSRIACTYISCAVQSAPVILYSHSNADDLGTVVRHLRTLSRTLFCHVFSYDYSGYGLSENNSSVANLYADAEAAYLALRFYYGFNQDEIILYGSSLGSVAAAYLAVKYGAHGVIMLASVSSGLRLLCRGGLSLSAKESLPFDVLDNISLAERIRVPTLVIHGEADQLCSIDGARQLYKRLPFPAQPAFFAGVGHDEVNLFRLANLRMSYFIHSETGLIWSQINGEMNGTLV